MEVFFIECVNMVEIFSGTYGDCIVYRVNGYSVRCLCFEVGDFFEEFVLFVGGCVVKL